MSKKTSYLLGILLTILIGTFFYWKQGCCPCSKSQEEKISEPEKKVVEPEVKKAILAPFGIKDVNDALLSKMKSSFNYANSDFVFVDSLSKDVHDGGSLIKDYLDNNAEKKLNITGFYRADEENKSAFTNLGLARANAVKTFMTSKGVAAKSINLSSKLNESLTTTGIIYDAIDLKITDTTAEVENKEEEALKLACEALKGNPIVLNFKISQANINLTPEEREKFSKITQCVDKLNATVQVIGHTDATGNPDFNIVLGQNRADFAKAYLVKNGIPSNKIKATSKGQTDPITTNTTAAGRAKNRRTVITIE